MRPWPKFWTAIFVVPLSVVVWGQDHAIRPGSEAPMVRLSFHRGSAEVSDFDDAAFTQVCLSVVRDGHYQMRHVSAKRGAEMLQGTLSPHELKRLGGLLGNADVRSQEGSSGGLLRNSAETFTAEVQRKDGVQRFTLTDTDGESPFPRSVLKIVAWLQGFDAQDAKHLAVDTEDICPGGALQPVHPVSARLKDLRPSGACVAR